MDFPIKLLYQRALNNMPVFNFSGNETIQYVAPWDDSCVIIYGGGQHTSQNFSVTLGAFRL